MILWRHPGIFWIPDQVRYEGIGTTELAKVESGRGHLVFQSVGALAVIRLPFLKPNRK